MPPTSTIVVGHHTYTHQDAQRTLGGLDALWHHHRHLSAPDPSHDDLARTFLTDAARAASVPVPVLDHVETAFGALTAGHTATFSRLDPECIATILHATWEFFPRLRRLDHRHDGVVAHLHASKGLPKKAIATADIGWRGVRGDVQRARAHHGRPWQALCLWSTDALDTLRNEGHPIAPGFAGENITVSGVPADAFRPGCRFRIGALEGFLTSYSIPCSQNSGWFADGDFSRIHFERGDQSRVYAMVTATGSIAVGDRFELTGDR